MLEETQVKAEGYQQSYDRISQQFEEQFKDVGILKQRTSQAD